MKFNVSLKILRNGQVHPRLRSHNNWINYT